MAMHKREAAIGTVGAIVVVVHLVLAAIGTASLGQWLGGVAAGLFLIGFVTLHAVVGPRIGHGPRRKPYRSNR